jgi:hypothetical protein
VDGSRSDTAAAGASLVGNVLAHHGVKGMKWGVRKDAGHEGESAKTTKIAKLDNQFQEKTNRVGLQIGIYNKAGANYAKEDIDRINNKSQYKNVDFTKDSPIRQKYYAEHQKAFVSQLEKEAGRRGTNASGTKKYSVHENPDGSWRLVTTDVKHADDSVPLDVKYDKRGFITGVSVASGSMAQSQSLEHHGIKGMKWGHRKGSSSSTTSSHPGVSADHQNAEAIKTKLRTGGVSSLANHELQSLNTRMQLEANHRNLSGQQPNKFEKGHSHVKKVLAAGKTLSDIYNTVNSPAGKALKTALKVGAKVS